jgi:hypothetical protein
VNVIEGNIKQVVTDIVWQPAARKMRLALLFVDI